jgi:hypothetical protein
LIKYAADKLKIKDLEPIEAKEIVYKYFLENYIRKGYLFHGFNGAFEKSILTNGLDPEMRFWDWKDLSEIKDIFARAGEDLVMGWAYINSQGNTFLADQAGTVYYYGVASPEWFSQFTSGGAHIPLSKPYDKKAYKKRDYDSAKRNIIMFCDSLMNRSDEDLQKKQIQNITSEEKIEILNFFEKYWKILVSESTGPKCALINRSAINMHEHFAESYADDSKKTERTYKGKYSLQISIHSMISSRDIDKRVTEKISPKDIKIINLPEYTKIHEN